MGSKPAMCSGIRGSYGYYLPTGNAGRIHYAQEEWYDLVNIPPLDSVGRHIHAIRRKDDTDLVRASAGEGPERVPKTLLLTLNQTTQHWHTDSPCKRAIWASLGRQVYESHVDWFRRYELSSLPGHLSIAGFVDGHNGRSLPGFGAPKYQRQCRSEFHTGLSN